MKKNFFPAFPALAAILCACLLLPPAAFAEPQTPQGLPEIPGWQNGVSVLAPLDTVSGSHGFWAERSYRTAEGGAFKATWMCGKGPAFLYPPASGVTGGDGPVGAGATYETHTINERGVILEVHPTLGLSLILRMPGGVLTLESGPYGMDETQLLKAAETLAIQIAPR